MGRNVEYLFVYLQLVKKLGYDIGVRKWKLPLWGLLFWFLSWLAIGGLARVMVYPRFLTLVMENLREDVERLQSSLQHEAEGLRKIASDYSFWDETVRFIKERHQEYRVDNLNPENLENLDIDHLLLFDAQGRFVEGMSLGRYGTSRPGSNTMPPELQWINREHALIKRTLQTRGELGLIPYDNSVALLSMTAILPSDKSGNPQGLVLVVRVMGLNGMEQLRKRLRSEVRVLTSADDSLYAPWLSLLSLRNPIQTMFLPDTLGKLQVHGLLAMPELRNDNVSVFLVTREPKILQKAMLYLRVLFVVAMLFSLIPLILGTLYYFNRWLLPLQKMASSLKQAKLGEPLDNSLPQKACTPLLELSRILEDRFSSEQFHSKAMLQQSESITQAIGQLSSQNLLYATAILSLPQPAVVIDAKGKIQIWNRALDALTQKKYRHLLNIDMEELAEAIYGESRPLPLQCLLNDAKALERYSGQVQWTSDGIHLEEFVALPSQPDGCFILHEAIRMRNPAGGVIGMVCTFIDATKSKRAEGGLLYLNLHDTLTGLPGPTYFQEVIRRMETAQAFPLGLLMVEIADLELVQNTLGESHAKSSVLATVGVMRQALGLKQMLLRIAPDRLALFIPNATESQLKLIQEDIEKEVVGYNKKVPPLPLHLHYGCAFSEEQKPVQDLIMQAESQLKQDLEIGKVEHLRLAQSLQERHLQVTAGDSSGAILVSRVREFASVLGLEGSVLERAADLARWKDLGKLALPSSIPLKPGPLDEREQDQVRHHPEVGYRIALLDSKLAPLADLILRHCEWWNGEGYPLGLHGEEIPLECRLVAVVEAFTLMTTPRPRSRIYSPAEALAELRSLAGKKFDPGLVECFVDHAANRNWISQK